jgi:hypothetical protein
MKELLEEQLMEYLTEFKRNKRECIELMRSGKPWH